MKSILSRLFSFGAAAVFLFSSAATLPASADDEGLPDFDIAVTAPPQVIFIGDSIISGYGLKDYSPDDKLKCESFANILSREFEAELPAEIKFRYYNEGLDGRTSGELLELLQSGALDKKLKKADAVIVSIGGNDMLDTFLELLSRDNAPMQALAKAASLSRDLDDDLDGFEKNMPLITEELLSRTDGQVFVQTLYNPMEATALPVINRLSAEKIGRLNSIIKECSQDGEKYIVCDVFSKFVGRSRELTNIDLLDIHPNAEGHKLISEVLGETIRSETYIYHDSKAEKIFKREHPEEYAELLRKREQVKYAEELKKNGPVLIKSAAAGTGGVFLLSMLLIRNGWLWNE